MLLKMARKQCGMTLIEVAISMFVLAVGVLGMMSMQASSKRAGYEAVQRTTAAALAQDIIERMRVNNAVLASYDTGAVLGGGTRSAQACGEGDACTTANIVAYDLYQWEQALDGASEQRDVDGDDDNDNVGGLVNPTGCLTHSAGVVTVAIAWRGFQALSNPTSDSTDCGEGSGKYGDDDEYRQVLEIETYIAS